jgi:choline kinase
VVNGLQGAIIAAGSGQRLRNDVGGIPKPLVELGGEPLLVRQAYAMLRAGATRVIAVVNSETAGLIAGRKMEIPPELRLFVRDTANSMESLFALGEKLEPARFLLATVDAVVPDAEFARFVRVGLELTVPDESARFDGVLGLVRWRGDGRPLFAKVSNGAVTAVGDGPAPMVTAGVYLLPAKIFDFADGARRAQLGALREFLAMLLEKGIRLGALELSGIIDVDEGADLEVARAKVEEGR